MKKAILPYLILCGCTSLQIPPEFVYKEVNTARFKIASYQKITAPDAPFKIYIEGDGYAFNSSGRVSRNPTPRGTLLREIAFGDDHANVVYLGRPCQYVEDNSCKPEYWSTARFSPEVVRSEYEAVKAIAGNNRLTLTGFSGGAQVIGLMAVKYPDLQIEKLVTIAGNLDVKAWIAAHNLPPLNLSEDLSDYRTQYGEFPQVHYVGSDDGNILPQITADFILDKDSLVLVEGADHNHGWEKAFPAIRRE